MGALVEAEAFTFGRIASISLPYTTLFESYLLPEELEVRGVADPIRSGGHTYGLQVVHSFGEFEEVTMLQAMFKEMPALFFKDKSDSALRECLKTKPAWDLIGESAGFVIARIYDGESILLGVKHRG